MKSKTVLTNLALLITSTILITYSNDSNSTNEEISHATKRTSSVDSIEF